MFCIYSGSLVQVYVLPFTSAVPRHMEDHGVPVFYGIRQVFTDNRRETDVDGIAEKDSGEGFCDDGLHAECF